MTERIEGTVTALQSFPVKALSPMAHDTVDLEPGATLPHDRIWAIEVGTGRFDPDDPQHLPKVAFLTLMRYPRLAALKTGFDPEAQRLSIRRGPMELASGCLDNAEGRARIESFFADYLGDEVAGPLRTVHAPGHSFSDVAVKCLHVVNLASVRALERAMGRVIDPLRFRPNVIVDLPLPWIEFSWVGSEIRLGGAMLEVLEPTERCAAANVDPSAGRRDIDVCAGLEQAFGHRDMGVYAVVRRGGTLSPQDRISGPGVD